MILNFPPLKDQSPTAVCFFFFFFEKVIYIDVQGFCCYICSLQQILKTKNYASNVENTFSPQ